MIRGRGASKASSLRRWHLSWKMNNEKKLAWNLEEKAVHTEGKCDGTSKGPKTGKKIRRPKLTKYWPKITKHIQSWEYWKSSFQSSSWRKWIQRSCLVCIMPNKSVARTGLSVLLFLSITVLWLSALKPIDSSGSQREWVENKYLVFRRMSHCFQ